MIINNIKAFCINLSERKDRWDNFISQKFPFPVERFDGIKTTIGRTGCLQSHVNILRNVKEPTFIFEDDFLLINNFSLVEKSINQLPPDWDLLYLGAILHKKLERYSDNLFKLRKGWAAHAILYNNSNVIKKIIEDYDNGIITKEFKSFDTYLARDIQKHFNCFITCPIIGIQSTSYSDIIQGERNYKDIMIGMYDKFTKDNL